MKRSDLDAILDRRLLEGCEVCLGAEGLLIRPRFEGELSAFQIRFDLTQHDLLNGAVLLTDNGSELELPAGISCWADLVTRANLISCMAALEQLARETTTELQRATGIQTVLVGRDLASKLTGFSAYLLRELPRELARSTLSDTGESRW